MRCKLSDLSDFAIESVSFTEASVENYVSTESMIADRGGITEPSALPKSGSIRRYRPGDVLISNIRPYFKKIWRATRTGTCSNDVLVIRSNGSCNPAYLYYVLSSDDFFNYMTATSKGTKMPRGDKEAIMDYEIDLPSLEQQEQFTSTMSKIDDLIWTNSKINDYLDEQMKITYEHVFQDCEYFIPLGDFCDVQKGLSYKGNSLGMSGSLLVNLGNIQPGGGFRADNNKFYIGEFKPKHQVKAGDIVIANTDMTQDRVILGSPAIVPDYEGTILFTHHLFAFRDVEVPISFLYYYLRSSDFHNKCESSANGTTVLAVNRDDVLSCLVPADMEKIRHFGSICDKYLKLMKINGQQKIILKTIRDSLIKEMLVPHVDK